MFAGTKDLVKIDGTPYFETFGDSFWDLWVLITTANNPDIMVLLPFINDNPFTYGIDHHGDQKCNAR